MEELALSLDLDCAAAVFLSDVNGLHTTPPSSDPTARLITKVVVSKGCKGCGERCALCACAGGFTVAWHAAAGNAEGVEMSALEHDVTQGMRALRSQDTRRYAGVVPI